MASNSPNSARQIAFDRARVTAVVAPIARAHGAEVVDVEFKSERGGWVLRVLVEKLGSAEARASTKDSALDLDRCSTIAQELSPALDVADPIPHRYSLEVSSPGLERSLRGPEDFARFAGEKARIKLDGAVDGQSVLVGTLIEASDASVTVDSSGREVVVPFDKVASARLVFEFGPAPKPGKGPKRAGPKNAAGSPRPGKEGKRNG